MKGRLSFYTDTVREVLARCLVLEVFTLLVLEVFLIRLLKCLRLSRDSVELQASRTTRDGSRAKCKAFFAKYCIRTDTEHLATDYKHRHRAPSNRL